MTFVQLAGPPDVPARGSSMGVSNVDRARHEDTVQFDRDVPDEAYSVQSDARTEGSEPIPLPEVDSAPAVSAGGQTDPTHLWQLVGTLGNWPLAKSAMAPWLARLW